ncbi:hypothetical protein [Brevundimonas abyssalis]|uniref:Uncharacterized protein n=1 Tax=Brevundimonas abyssalis TAR-001 TaxID=1391729 RepID=A0A8E0KKU5_9CAUL|nr:hypothetical protein [Brevundimonas abyssalis]GAD58262.1 hypothetical protein MBEBAB_0512 [Brevundimonas abyssalis TAR-001]
MSVAQLRRSHNRRHEIADEIVAHLTTFECDLGRALESGSRLVGFLPGARTDADLSATVGQDAIGHFVISLGLISKAMESAVDGHHSLDKTRQHFRIDVSAGGDKDIIPGPVRGTSGSAQADPVNALP